jgi:hypothetical protein
MTVKRRVIIGTLLGAFMVVVIVGFNESTWPLSLIVPSRSIYRRPNDQIEAYLRSDTPLGSSRRQVQAWMIEHRIRTIFRQSVPDSSPDLLAFVEHHSTLVSSVTVSALYKFGADDRLVSVTVSTTTDGL